ncbi:MAG: hypothetical protein JW808_04570 [Victivallales bacterium]|nr:hypothetical protein [Victivallales bacterium]
MPEEFSQRIKAKNGPPRTKKIALPFRRAVCRACAPNTVHAEFHPKKNQFFIKKGLTMEKFGLFWAILEGAHRNAGRIGDVVILRTGQDECGLQREGQI